MRHNRGTIQLEQSADMGVLDSHSSIYCCNRNTCCSCARQRDTHAYRYREAKLSRSLTPSRQSSVSPASRATVIGEGSPLVSLLFESIHAFACWHVRTTTAPPEPRRLVLAASTKPVQQQQQYIVASSATTPSRWRLSLFLERHNAIARSLSLGGWLCVTSYLMRKKRKKMQNTGVTDVGQEDRVVGYEMWVERERVR